MSVRQSIRYDLYKLLWRKLAKIIKDTVQVFFQVYCIRCYSSKKGCIGRDVLINTIKMEILVRIINEKKRHLKSINHHIDLWSTIMRLVGKHKDITSGMNK